MRRALLLIVVVILLIAGGYLSYAISKQNGATLLGLRVQTDNPDASVASVTPTKGAEFLVMTVVTFGLLGGFATFLSLLFWYLNRQVAQARATDKPTKSESQDLPQAT